MYDVNFFVFIKTEICQVAENTLDRSQTVTKRILKTCLKTRFVKPLQTKFITLNSQEKRIQNRPGQPEKHKIKFSQTEKKGKHKGQFFNYSRPVRKRFFAQLRPQVEEKNRVVYSPSRARKFSSKIYKKDFRLNATIGQKNNVVQRVGAWRSRGVMKTQTVKPLKI